MLKTRKFLLFVIACFILTVLISGCEVQHRRYRDGLYLTSLNRHKVKTPVKPTQKLKTPTIAVTSAKEIEVLPQVHANANRKPVEAFIVNEPPIKVKSEQNLPDSCDKLLFRDGSELRAKVTEVTPTEVKYRRCDHPNGPIYVTRKSDLFLITFANGTKEVIKSDVPENVPFQQNQGANTLEPNPDKVLHPGAYISMISSIICALVPILSIIYFSVTGIEFTPALLLGLILLALFAVALGIIAIAKVKNNPEVYKGLGMARFGIIMASIMLGIYLILSTAVFF